MKDWIEIQFWEYGKYLIRKGYGADCETKDLDDLGDIAKDARCGSCYAEEMIEWIDNHIKLLEL